MPKRPEHEGDQAGRKENLESVSYEVRLTAAEIDLAAEAAADMCQSVEEELQQLRADPERLDLQSLGRSPEAQLEELTSKSEALRALVNKLTERRSL